MNNYHIKYIYSFNFFKAFQCFINTKAVITHLTIQLYVEVCTRMQFCEMCYDRRIIVPLFGKTNYPLKLHQLGAAVADPQQLL